ncbi:helix-turn-helix domain-containing protein [Bacillus sp. FJAT-29814]|uniref:AlbA family DNA-binding domain-containing protein n=1 Tax=Bacillus sp. FJAT-29814 TaxID=1729688 RepID=UPI00082BC53D|nr:ATP-binding protein [Bacillus sp. FJAT-29814]
MKNSWEWTEEDVLELIKNEIPESLNLDYKQIDSLANTDGKKNELSKDVSAFANSAGGVLIYGVIEDGHVPTSIDEGVDPNVISKEWIEQVIDSRIQRRIPGIRINQIKLSNPSGNVIYVIDVPQSHFAPHMAADKRYYKRFNFKSVPMEEYEVRDVGNRNQTPDLEFMITLDENQLTFPQNLNISNPMNFNFVLQNHSVVPAEYTTVQFFVDIHLSSSNIGGLIENGQTELTIGETRTKAKKYYKHIAIPASVPIMNGISYAVGNAQFRFYKEEIPYLIYVKLITARMEPREFLFVISHNKNIVQVQSMPIP